MSLQELHNIEFEKLNLHEMKDITADIIGGRTKKLRDELEALRLEARQRQCTGLVGRREGHIHANTH